MQQKLWMEWYNNKCEEWYFNNISLLFNPIPENYYGSKTDKSITVTINSIEYLISSPSVFCIYHIVQAGIKIVMNKEFKYKKYKIIFPIHTVAKMISYITAVKCLKWLRMTKRCWNKNIDEYMV